jgi:hypothetical protein
MLRRKRPSSNEKDAPARKQRGRFRTALTDAGWAVREHVFWRFGDALRHGGELVSWPFERAAWAVRRGLVWRVGDRFAALGPATRGATFGLIILAVAGAGVTALLLATPDRPTEQTSTVAAVVAEPEPVVTPAPEPRPAAKPQPTLQGATPIFTPERESGTGKKGAGDDKGSSSSSTTASSGSGQPKPLASVLSSSGPKPAAATASSSARDGKAKNVVAGPKALDVARDFAAAFVLYETGRGNEEVRETFAETTAPDLRHSLLRRPPRLPANVKVPKAKVLNVVPGPAHGGVYTVSVALLRVGLTSELRLDMEPAKGKRWQVTNILG